MPYGPAQGLINMARKLPESLDQFSSFMDHPVDNTMHAVGGWLGLRTPSAQPQQDTSWHDQRVQEANEGFRKRNADITQMKKGLK